MPLPWYLEGILTEKQFNKWFREKINDELHKDRKRGRKCAKNATYALYKQKLFDALCAGGTKDPFTGETMQWELVLEWNPEKAAGIPGYFRQFYLMPTIDHIDPDADAPAFEVCSWKINMCKSCQTPDQFIAMCSKVVDTIVNHNIPSPSKIFCGGITHIGDSSRIGHRVTFRRIEMPGKSPFSYPPHPYPLPPFLEGIVTPEQFRIWLFHKARTLLDRDRKAKRLCAQGANRKMYRDAIYDALMRGALCDPYTGEPLAWDKLGLWNPEKDKDLNDNFEMEFSLLPSVDHIDPNAGGLKFEICGWLVNTCKNNFTPDEFVAICRDVLAHCSPEMAAIPDCQI
jgi:hypothetical protein